MYYTILDDIIYYYTIPSASQVYPRQESMVGPDFQAVVPKQNGPGTAKASRRDTLVWSPRQVVYYIVWAE